MNGRSITVPIWAATLILCMTGCSHKTDANSELEKAAKALESTSANQPPPAQATSASVSQPATTAAAPTPPPAQQVNQALAAYKAGQLEDAVTRLQKLRATPALTPEQRMALQDAMAAVMTDIYSMAAKGDTRAQQAIKQYNQMQTSRPAH